MDTKIAAFSRNFIEAGWLVAILVAPLFFNPHATDAFDPNKTVIIRMLAGLMLLAWACLLLEQTRGDDTFDIKARLRALTKKPLFWPIALFLMSYVISTLFSIAPSESFWGNQKRTQGFYSVISYVFICVMMVRLFADPHAIGAGN